LLPNKPCVHHTRAFASGAAMLVKQHRLKMDATPSDFANAFAEFETLNKATCCIKVFADLM
jgi:hypothetical protein